LQQLWERNMNASFFHPVSIVTYEQVKDAVTNGNENLVRAYLQDPNCPLTDPLPDNGYPDQDGYNSTVTHSLLYEAVPHPNVLSILLRDNRISPYGVNNDAFYRCLYSGSIEGLKCFNATKGFIFPENTLAKAAELGGIKLMEYLLGLPPDDPEKYLEQLIEALDIAENHNDSLIMTLLVDTIHSVCQETTLTPL
jgi:hypothetical protein